MSKEKQIEEIVKDLDAIYSTDFKGDYKSGLRDIAERLYNAGFRKQSEGEWIWINQAKGYLEPPYGDTCKCSLCEFVIDVSETHFRFCPNCGAKMKGGAE